jgi:hypothetical protein
MLSFDADLPWHVIENALMFWRIIMDDWSGWPIAAIVLGLPMAYALIVWQRCLLLAWARGQGRWSAARNWFLLLAAVALIGLLSPGALLMLRDPLARVPRILLFLGPLLCALTLQVLAAVLLCRRSSPPTLARQFTSKLAVGAFAWLLVVFAYAYGHAFSAQTEFEQGRISRLIDGVYRFQGRLPEVKINEIAFVDGMPESPLLVNTQRKFPLMNRLVPRLINEDWFWGHKQLQFYGLKFANSRLNRDPVPRLDCRDPRSTECTAEYALQLRGQAVLVWMRR